MKKRHISFHLSPFFVKMVFVLGLVLGSATGLLAQEQASRYTTIYHIKLGDFKKINLERFNKHVGDLGWVNTKDPLTRIDQAESALCPILLSNYYGRNTAEWVLRQVKARGYDDAELVVDEFTLQKEWIVEQSLFAVQLGVFKKTDNYSAFIQQMPNSQELYTEYINGSFKVYVGYFTREAEAEKLTQAMHQLGYDAFVKHLRNPIVEGVPFRVVYQGPDTDREKLPLSLKPKAAVATRSGTAGSGGQASKTAIMLKSKPIASKQPRQPAKTKPKQEYPDGLAQTVPATKQDAMPKLMPKERPQTTEDKAGSKLTDIDEVLAENTDERPKVKSKNKRNKQVKDSEVDFAEVFKGQKSGGDIATNSTYSTLGQIDETLPNRGDFIPLYDFIYELDGEVTDSSMLVTSIKIYNKNGQGKRGNLMQEIINLRSEVRNPEDRMTDFVVEDLNFDGIMDIRLMDFIPTGPRISYLYWVFDEGQQQFVNNTALEQLRSPTVDYENEWLVSTWGTNQSNGTHFYRFEGQELVLFRHELRERQANNKYQLTVFEKQGENARLQKVLEKVED